jgi:hypothetical protein
MNVFSRNKQLPSKGQSTLAAKMLHASREGADSKAFGRAILKIGGFPPVFVPLALDPAKMIDKDARR